MAKCISMISWAAAIVLTTGATRAETITQKSGSSSSTITQEGGGKVERKVNKTPNGQEIIQRSGGNTATVTQKKSSGNSSRTEDSPLIDEEMEGMKCSDKPARKGKQAGADDEDCPDNLSALDEKLDERRRALDSTDGAEPRRFGRGFERVHALKDRMEAFRRQ